MGTFELAMIGVIIAFIPLIVSTALATGVYQAVGLTTVMLVGCLAPTWWLAPVFGFVAEFVEIQLLGLLGKGLSKFPELSKCGDYIRDAMVSCIGLALVAGFFLAERNLGCSWSYDRRWFLRPQRRHRTADSEVGSRPVSGRCSRYSVTTS